MHYLAVTQFVAALSLGLLAGALLTEAGVLVPHWRAISAEEFTRLHQGFAPRLFSFFAPLTTVAVLSATVAGAVAAVSGPSTLNEWASIGTTILALSLLAFYGLYFAGANRRLPGLAAESDRAPFDELLKQWQRVHMLRTTICIVAFGISLSALAA
jgi:Domain of unknown function (DUF1772)